MFPYQGRVAIVTSFNSYHAYAPYVISLARTLGVLSGLGIKWDYLARPADFHIERAINNTLSELMARDDFTDVFMIDSDESWEPEGFVRLLLHPQEIVGATYRMKNREQCYVGCINYKDGQPHGIVQKDGSALLAADRVAAGFIRIKIPALRKWAAAYPELVSIEPDGVKHQFFSRHLAEDEQGRKFAYCQDMAFSKRWKDIGGELWIDPMVHVGHWWFTNHQGDFDAHLREGKALADAKALDSESGLTDAMKIVQEMAEQQAA